MNCQADHPPLAVRVWGTDKNGQDFSQIAQARDCTEQGALLEGVEQYLVPGGIVGVQYQEKRTLARILQVWSNHIPQLSIQLFDPALCPWKGALGLTTAEGQRERRRAPRYKISLAIDVQQQHSSIPTHFQTSDISVGGFYVETILPLAVGTRLSVTVWLGKQKLVTDAIVRTCHNSVGMGVQLVDMAPQDERRLAEFLEQQHSAREQYTVSAAHAEIAPDPLLEP